MIDGSVVIKRNLVVISRGGTVLVFNENVPKSREIQEILDIFCDGTVAGEGCGQGRSVELSCL